MIDPNLIALETVIREGEWINAQVREILGEYWSKKFLKNNFFWNFIIKRKFKIRIIIKIKGFERKIEILLNGKVYSTYSHTLINNLKK